nr:MAG TPA: hypothetical protein [Caudoviricetes sp.]
MHTLLTLLQHLTTICENINPILDTFIMFLEIYLFICEHLSKLGKI